LKLQVTVEGKSYEVEVEILEEDESTRQPGYAPYQPVPAAAHSMPYSDAHAYLPVGGGVDGGEKVCRSPVTGLTVRVYVEPGKQIQAGDLIMVLEAMKMETNVTAHLPGTVKSVHVAPGDSVKVNQILVEFE
jgi:methylmalonyl-CoA carboxyltransferase small subunit